MDMRGASVAGGMSLVFCLLLPLIPQVHAAVGDEAEAAEAQILQTIEATRASDPELATEMERQLHLMESGDSGVTAAERETPSETLGTPELVGPPVDAPDNFEEVQADPRMQDIRQQFEGGQLSEAQAREKMFDVLRDHGIEPNDGHEWEHQGGQSEGMERAFERMSTEGREHMESMERESMERMFEAPLHEMEAPERSSDMPMPEHESEMPEPMMSEPQTQGGM